MEVPCSCGRLEWLSSHVDKPSDKPCGNCIKLIVFGHWAKWIRNEHVLPVRGRGRCYN